MQLPSFKKGLSRPITESTSRLIVAEEEDFDTTDSLLEFFLMQESSYFDIQSDIIHATHIGLKDNNAEIIREGLGDFAKSAVEFFKRMIKKLKEFVAKMFLHINAYIMSFDKFLTKYADKLNKLNPDFKIQGRVYTISANVPKLDKIDAVVNSFNTELNSVHEKTREKIMEMRRADLSEANISSIRAHTLGVSAPIGNGGMSEAIKKAFRNGSTTESDIIVNKSMLDTTINEYPKTKAMLKECVSQKDKVILLLEDIRSFFERGATIQYDGPNSTQQVHLRTIDVNKDRDGVDKTDHSTMSNNSEKLSVINDFYNYKMALAKEVGNISVQVMTEKITALKESLAQSRVIVRQSLSHNRKEA